MLKICTRGWECVLGERSVWSVLSFVFDKKCVRLTSDREVGNRIVTDKAQVGWMSKIKPRVSKLNLRQTISG